MHANILNSILKCEKVDLLELESKEGLDVIGTLFSSNFSFDNDLLRLNIISVRKFLVSKIICPFHCLIMFKQMVWQRQLNQDTP